MNITGLIVEYNPFHNGHIYHLQKSLEKTNADASIAVMSGNFIQRGEPALFDKFAAVSIIRSRLILLIVFLLINYIIILTNHISFINY